ncbi:hypothetical protein DC20_16505 [Rufibacter tibetensis]|uniref:Uncharacterized protein n=1 Tax=Rufibacter tibetensis TaxID=512763 RepID=A0A0P0CS72_9BACT|nr:hypothetical protein DC20_16505 [Rufibacter tibetensis]
MQKDSTLTEVKSKIMFDERNISYLEAENKSFTKGDPLRMKRVYPADTRFVHRVEEVVFCLRWVCQQIVAGSSKL